MVSFASRLKTNKTDTQRRRDAAFHSQTQVNSSVPHGCYYSNLFHVHGHIFVSSRRNGSENRTRWISSSPLFSRFMAVEFASTSPGFWMLLPTALQTVTAPTVLVPPEAAHHQYVATCSSLWTWLLSDRSQTFVFRRVLRFWSSKLPNNQSALIFVKITTGDMPEHFVDIWPSIIFLEVNNVFLACFSLWNLGSRETSD